MPYNRGKNTTLIASITFDEGMGESMLIEGSTTGAVFEGYVETFLAPKLRKGQIVIMDNLKAHKGERVRQLIEAKGCEVLFLPAYSPDLNPIEETFSKIKGILRELPLPARAKHYGRRYPRRSLWSRLKMREVSSDTAGTN